MKEELHPRRILSAVIILGIGFIFAINWGPGARGCESPLGANAATTAARVNGQEIPLRTFQLQYAMQMRQLEAGGRRFTPEMAQQFGIPQMVLDQMITGELLSQEAKKRGIAASNAELRTLIRSSPDFQRDGKFDMEQYTNVVSQYYGKTVPEYEMELHKQLAAQKLLDLVQASAVVSDDEVRSRYQRDGNKAQVTFARFLPSMYADKAPAPTAAEVERFRAEKAAEIAAYYEANKATYQQPERIHARHILIKFGPDQASKDAARAKAEQIRKEIQGGKSFADAAREHSEDRANKDQGGDLGVHDRSAWVPEFSNAAFALEPGKLSEPVESPFGYHLIQVDQKLPEEKKELKDVEAEIARILLQRDAARALAKAEAEKALAAAKGGKSLATLFPPEKDNQPAALRFETETRPEAIPSGEFTSGADGIPYLGPAPQALAAVFAVNQPQLLDQVFEAGEGYAVVEVTQRSVPSPEDFEKQKDTLRSEARQGKQTELRESFVRALRKTAQIETNADAVGTITGATAG